MTAADFTAHADGVVQDLATLLNLTWALGAVVVPHISKEFDVSYSFSWRSGGREHVKRVEWDYAAQQWRAMSTESEGEA